MHADTIIIGGGQAGLSTARYFKEMGYSDFIILDQNTRPGDSWRERYDSLELDSYARYSHLENFHFDGPQCTRPNKDDIADYLARFAKHFSIDPVFNTKVVHITKEADIFTITTIDQKTYTANNIVIATGPFHSPHIPFVSKNISDSIHQIHSSEYKNPKQLKPGTVLIIGGGNSGAEFAEEVADSGRQVYFSFRRKLRSVGSTELHQWLAYVIGIAHLPKRSLVGSLALWYTRGKAVGLNLKNILTHPRITPVGEFLEVKDNSIICKQKEIPFADISTIVWATGFRDDFSLVHIPGFDKDSVTRGVSNIPGLYFLNLRWHHSKSSSHLAGVSRDAKYIAKKIAE